MTNRAFSTRANSAVFAPEEQPPRPNSAKAANAGKRFIMRIDFQTKVAVWTR